MPVTSHQGCVCASIDGYRIRKRGCTVHLERDAAHWQEADRRKFGTTDVFNPTDEFVKQAFIAGAAALWPNSQDPGWGVTFERWLARQVAPADVAP